MIGAPTPGRRGFLAAVLSAVVLPALLRRAAAAHPHGPSARGRRGAVERQVAEARERIRSAAAAGDAAGLRALYAADFIHTRGCGAVEGRGTRIAALLAGAPAIELAREDGITVRVLHPDTAVLRGRSTLAGAGEVRWVQVFVRRDGGWAAAASEDTPVPPGRPTRGTPPRQEAAAATSRPTSASTALRSSSGARASA